MSSGGIEDIHSETNKLVAWPDQLISLPKWILFKVWGWVPLIVQHRNKNQGPKLASRMETHFYTLFYNCSVL